MQQVAKLTPARLPTSREAFYASPQPSLKVSSYFEVYDEMFAAYRGRPITFVEVGVLNGGSLFMWREFFGPQARIIGVDLNPGAQRWTGSGFEIVTGDQADPAFWAEFCRGIGEVDILLDDGGHTFEQQIVTVEGIMPTIRNGGLLVVEDAHTSYMREFGGPSTLSFISYAKNIVDGINQRFPGTGGTPNRIVRSVTFYESIVAMRIDRTSARSVPAMVVNSDDPLEAEDYRYRDSGTMKALAPFRARLARLKSTPVVGAAMVGAYRQVQALRNIARSRKLRRYFRH